MRKIASYKIVFMGASMFVYILWAEGREVEHVEVYIGTQNCTELTEHFHGEIIDECIEQESEKNCDVEAFL